MKYIKNTCFLLFLLLMMTGQQTFAADTDLQTFEVEGIKVVFQPSVKEVVSVQLFIDGGTAHYSKEQEGIEGISLDWATQGGTKNYPKTDYLNALEKMGSSIGGSSDYDYATLSMKSLARFFDETWKLYVDAINNPLLEEEEFNNLKNQWLASAQQAQSDPDSHLRNLTMSHVFAGKSYANNPAGSPESLEAMKVEEVRAYYQNLIGKNNMTLVIVGNLNADDLKKKVAAAFGKTKQEGTPMLKETKMMVTKPKLQTEEREIATNYIRGYMNAPSLGTKDEVAMRVAMSILRNRLFDEVRTKRNLSYAPSSFFPSSILRNPYMALYVSTTKPNESIQVMTDELRKLRTEGFNETELKNKKGEFITFHYLQQESNASLANSIGRAALSPGGLEHRAEFMEMVEKLTIEDLNIAIRKYATALDWTYLGDTSIIDETIFLAPIVDIEKEGRIIAQPFVKEGASNKKKKTKKKVLKRGVF